VTLAGEVNRRVGQNRAIHPSAWKGNSQNFALTAFSEVRQESVKKYCICVIRFPV
jgi:hypothetical protein